MFALMVPSVSPNRFERQFDSIRGTEPGQLAGSAAVLPASRLRPTLVPQTSPHNLNSGTVLD